MNSFGIKQIFVKSLGLNPVARERIFYTLIHLMHKLKAVKKEVIYPGLSFPIHKKRVR